jgi:Protein of unknown function (DUF402)
VTGSAPSFWSPGNVILWRYRRPDSSNESMRPMRVVRDDADGLVAWLAPGTPMLRPVLRDGADLRSVPLGERFDLARHGRATRLDTWRGQGTLKVAPTGVPWSVWLFWSEDWSFQAWYVNLEHVHTRRDDMVVTQDHVLDLVVQPDRSVELKDEDELAVAVAAGRFSPAEAARYRADAREVQDVVRRWGSPFRDGWEHWRPDPSWDPPQLPEDLVAGADHR